MTLFLSRPTLSFDQLALVPALGPMEIEFIRALRNRLPPSPHLAIGPGDDAAVLREDGAVVTCDMLCEGTHFSLANDAPAAVGRKAMAVNLSDLAAMAARPVAAFLAVALPKHQVAVADRLLEGMLPLAEQFDVAVAGGDTNVWDGPLVVSVTLIGRCPDRPLLRSGAQAGDHLLVTGSFGGSQSGHQFEFTPRIEEAIYLQNRHQLHAGIDCSDGLSLDSSRLGEESGCGVVIDLDAIPISAAAEAMDDGTKTPLARALGDGEDFELILAVPPAEAETLISTQPLETKLTRVGTFIDRPGLWQAGDPPKPLAAVGYEHGA